MGTDACIDGNLISDARALPVDVVDRISRLLGRISLYDVLANGTLGALNATVEIDASGLATAGVGISGTWVGTIVAEGNVGDGVWDTIPLIDQTLASAALSTTVNNVFLLGIAGFLQVRLRMSLYTSGTAGVYIEGTSAPSGVFLTRSIPTGTNNIGDVDVATMPGWSYKQSLVDAQIKAGAGVVHTISVSQSDAAPTAGTITLYDSLTEAAPILWTMYLTAALFTPFTVTLDAAFATGLYLGLDTTGDVAVTVTYR